jgi:tetratricopeptide (TPR) repeat protein
VGGGPLEHFICRKCGYVNKPERRVCEKCGETLPKSFQVQVEELKKAVKENPRDAQTYRELGELYQTHHYVDEAVQAFEQAIKLNPDDGTSYRRLAEIYHTQGRCEDAIGAFRNVHRLGGEDFDSQLYLGFNYEMKGYQALAMKAYRRAIELNPHLAMARYHFGLLLLKSGNREGALEQCRFLGKCDRRLGQKLFHTLKRSP